MDPRTLAWTEALGRAAIGAALTLAPRRLGRGWVGRAGALPGTRVVTTAVGARDLALGLGLADALRTGREPRPWLVAGALADAADVAATLRAHRSIPTAAAVGVTTLAGGSLALALYLRRELDRPDA